MASSPNENPSVSSPGLFGSYPWVDNEKGYAALLFTFNFSRKDRIKSYTALKEIVDEAIMGK
ncbi:MAG: hypothetical protein IPP11_05755 [Chitinophagaceae bacterium]|nr:hypothetical protein [Chitinophagaceae bacterium]